jgi:NAD(P)-dependent dehydrogenase (short-subunit alcohol dehydrogenase family)
MQIKGAVALVTGANRGIGKAFAQALLDHGAAKVYAGARDVTTITDPRLTPIQLDVTDPASVARAAEVATDVTILVNNAGIGTAESLLGSEDNLRDTFEVNFFGLVAVTKAFTPILKANGRTAVVNMLSDASFRQARLGAYAVSKAAAWAATNSTRVDLAPDGILVLGVHVGFVDTDLTSWVAGLPKLDPAEVARRTMEGIEADAYEVLVAESSVRIKAGLSGSIEDLYADVLPARV